jgi:hypothetical protein
MKQEKSYAASIICVEAVISKCRASLTAKEIEMLEDLIHLLRELDQKKLTQEKQMLALSVLLKIASFLLNPTVFEKIKDLIHQLL